MLDQIASFIQGHDRFVISTHISPEGDALGSALAAYLVLKEMGKQAVVVMRDGVPHNLDFLPEVDRVIFPYQLDDDDYEQVMLVDCGKADRVGDNLFERFKGHFMINIDHHCDNPRYGNLHYVRELASATMVIDDVIEALGLSLNVELATCLYAGLMADTNGFRNANVNAGVLNIAAKWVSAGVDPHQVARNMFERQSWNETQLLAYALSSTEFEGGIAWCAIPRQTFDRFGVGHHQTDAIVSQLRSIAGVEISILLKEIDHNKVKVSLRAKGDVAVNGVAQHFGGGGHVKAAGCLVNDSLENVTQAVLDQVRKQLSPILQR